MSCVAAYTSGTHHVDLDIGGLTRSFLLKVPQYVDASDGLPALVSIHGFTSNPWYFDLLQGTDRYNEDQYYKATDPGLEDSFEFVDSGYKWLVALPFGTSSSGKDNPTCCGDQTPEQCALTLDHANSCAWNAGSCCGGSKYIEGVVDDVAFFRKLAEWLKSEMCAVETFATGFSNGAMMSNRIGCELGGTHYKAIAPLDGPLQFGYGFEECKPAEPVSVIQFCGAADGVCNKGIDSTMATWANVSGCNVTQPTVETFVSATTHCQRYTGCPGDTFVEWCMIDNLPHEYTGHERPGTSPSAQTSAPQPPTNIGGFRYLMNRFSTLVPATSQPKPTPFSKRHPLGQTANKTSWWPLDTLATGLVGGGAGVVVGAAGSAVLFKALHRPKKTTLLDLTLAPEGGYMS